MGYLLPNFIHIGASKAASSWLWNVCKGHPEIYVPPSHDNVNYFTVHPHRGLEWYQDTYFSEIQDELAIGEFSNSYLVYRPALERISRFLPKIKLTMTLRHPIEALYLAWAHVHLKDKPYGFDGRRGPGIPLEKCLHHHGHAWFRLYMDPRFYGRHLQNVFDLFPRSSVKVMFYQDLSQEPGKFLRSFFEFIDVDADFQTNLLGTEINPDDPRADPRKDMSPDLIQELELVFENDITRLEEMVGRDLSGWREL